MGRHAASSPIDAQPVVPGPVVSTVTDPRLFDAPLPAAPRAQRPQPQVRPTRPADAVPARPVAATPRVAQTMAAAHPRPIAPQTVREVQRTAVLLPPTISAPGMLVLRQESAPVPAAQSVSATAPIPIHLPLDEPVEDASSSFGSPRRGIKAAVCAVALLGAVSGAAVLMPNESSTANAAPAGKTPAGVSSAVGYACSPTTLTKRMRAQGHHARRAHSHGVFGGLLAALSGVGAAPTGTPASTLPSTTPSTAPSTAPQPTVSSSASATPSTSPSATPSSSAPTATPTPAPSTATPTTPSSPTPTGSATPSAPASSAPAPDATGGGDLRSLIRSNVGSLVLGAGKYVFSNFEALRNSDNFLGADATGSLIGSGTDSTVLRMQAGTSTRAGNVPTASGTTNQLSLIRLMNAKVVRDFTLQGTQQGHLYNGLRIGQSTNAKISNVRVNAVPGNDDNPPGETFGINDTHTTGSDYSNVEVDGANVGGANFGTNSSNDVTIENSYFHNSGHSHGATFWQTKNVTIRNTTSNDNYDTGFNFERVSGVVTLTNTTTKGNRLADIRVGSDKGTAVYNIVDPVFSGPKLRIMLTPKYFGVANLQRKSDIHVIINGKDRTSDVVEWVTHF